MSDEAAMGNTTRFKTSARTASPKSAFELPHLDLPSALRAMAEKGGVQTKENCGKMRVATEDLADMVEATFSTVAKGATECGLKAIDATRANTTAAFGFFAKLISAKSPSEVVELATAHAHQQFDALTRQNKEFLALAQKITADATEPIKTGVSKAFERGL